MEYTYYGPISLSTVRSDIVVDIQTRLQNVFGYSVGVHGIDGIYGNDTRNAVNFFQAANNLTVTGIVDQVTWNLLFYGTTITYSEKAIASVTGIKSVSGNANRSGLVTGGNIFTNVSIDSALSSNMVSYVLKLGQSSGIRSLNDKSGPIWMPLPVIPEQVSQSVSANWESTSIPGRASSYYSYVGTSNRTVNFSIQLHNDLLEMYKWSEGGVVSSSNDPAGLNMNKIIKFLESCCYPEYTAGKIIPPVVLLKIGDEVKMRGIINNVSRTSQLPFRDVSSGNQKYKRFLYSSISITFTEVPASNPSASTIYNYGSYLPESSLLDTKSSSYLTI